MDDLNKKEVAQEGSVQEQLLELKRINKSTHRCMTIYSITIIIILNLMFYRFNNSLQGLTDILQGSTDIGRGIITILQAIADAINRI